MKKLIIGISLMFFLMFGVVGIQNVMAEAFQVDVVNVDKIPDKDKDSKKDKNTKSSTSKANAKDGTCNKYDKCCKKSCDEKSGTKDTSKSNGKQK
jgi:hypothetical protein